MCEHFVRRLNLGGLDRLWRPMPESTTSKRRALIAEYAFSQFVEIEAQGDKRDRSADGANLIKQRAWEATFTRLAPFVREGLVLNSNFAQDELSEIEQIKTRLLHFFIDRTRRLVLRPVFNGCGFVDASEGDVIYGTSIYEVKTVERLFRSSDIRQVLIYAALNFASRQFNVDKIALVNPRRGQFCELDLEIVCSEISGLTSEELFANIIDAISSGEISR